MNISNEVYKIYIFLIKSKLFAFCILSLFVFFAVINIFLKFYFSKHVGREVSGEMTKPTYGCQVTIQSEQEKQMMKMYRREEKRERKRGKGTDDNDSSDAVMPFDPREMRHQRYIIPRTSILNFSFVLLQKPVSLRPPFLIVTATKTEGAFLSELG